MKLYTYLITYHSMNINYLSSLSGVKASMLEDFIQRGKPLRKNYRIQLERGIFLFLLRMGDTSVALQEILDEV